MHTKSDVLNSINIALTDELLRDINMGEADVYLNVNREHVMVAVGLGEDEPGFAEPQRFLITVHEAFPSAPDSDDWLTGRFIQTYTGKRFDLDNPQPEQVDIEDIAHALSLICRFTGHVKAPYSVATHCLLVSRLLEDAGYDAQTVYAGLLHDAAEAYIQDVSSPLKGMLRDYKAIEAEVADTVYDALGLDYEAVDWEAVKWADLTALFIERRDLLTPTGDEWVGEDEYAKGIEQVPHHARADLYWRDTRAAYMARYRQMRREVGLNA